MDIIDLSVFILSFLENLKDITGVSVCVCVICVFCAAVKSVFFHHCGIQLTLNFRHADFSHDVTTVSCMRHIIITS